MEMEMELTFVCPPNQFLTVARYADNKPIFGQLFFGG